jgi:hypothetical protein
MHEDTDLLVAGARKPELLHKRSHAATGLGDWRRRLVEASQRDDEATVDTRSLTGHTKDCPREFVTGKK